MPSPMISPATDSTNSILLVHWPRAFTGSSPARSRFGPSSGTQGAAGGPSAGTAAFPSMATPSGGGAATSLAGGEGTGGQPRRAPAAVAFVSLGRASPALASLGASGPASGPDSGDKAEPHLSGPLCRWGNRGSAGGGTCLAPGRRVQSGTRPAPTPAVLSSRGPRDAVSGPSSASSPLAGRDQRLPGVKGQASLHRGDRSLSSG